ncbi:MAG: hypothetical protein M1824_005746 [Vezdaea acicularis]|nr:MAG: hypothetical protein M1824_005746 [Vezdaea acicularis]
MASTHASLDAAATERKARLAKLKSLKRKQPPQDDEEDHTTKATSPEPREEKETTPDVTSTYLSGRNYDIATRGPKLGFETLPNENLKTLEDQAAQIARETAEKAKRDGTDKPIDLFTLQPKKPNWDLKRDVDQKMKILNVRTDNAIARLVRERIRAAQERAKTKAGIDGADGEAVGMEGGMLVEGVREREREEAEEERRDREDEEMA